MDTKVQKYIKRNESEIVGESATVRKPYTLPLETLCHGLKAVAIHRSCGVSLSAINADLGQKYERYRYCLIV